MKRSTWLIILAVIALVTLPLFFHADVDEDDLFAGADEQAMALIGDLNPDYEPWFAPLFEPPSGEIESLLFALQAALGAGLLGYYFGKRSCI